MQKQFKPGLQTDCFMKATEFKLSRTKSEFDKKQVTSSKQAYDYIKKFYFDDIDIYESTFILLLDQSAKTIGYAKVSQGGVAGTVVDIKIICKYAIDSLASGVILAHNYPSGSLSASVQDQNITKRVKDALLIMDVRLMDHLILTSDGYFSFADEGLI